MEENNIDLDVTNELLSEYRDCRVAIKKMIFDMEKLTEKLLTLFPDQIDSRYRHLFEEKIKTITALYSSLLDMRKEMTKSIKDEIEIRRKITSKDEEFSDEDIDVRGLASRVESLFKEKKNLCEKLEEICDIPNNENTEPVENCDVKH